MIDIEWVIAIILISSITFQIGAAYLAWKARYRSSVMYPWILIIAAMFLMVLRRISSFFSDLLFNSSPNYEYIISRELIALLTSLLIFVAFIFLNEYLENLEDVKESKNFNQLLTDLMTHDLRNYNFTALGYLELLQDVDLDYALEGKKEPSQFLQKAHIAIKNSDHLIDCVRALKQATAGSLMESKSIPISELINDTQRKVKLIYPEVNLLIKMEKKTDDVCKVHPAIEYILFNLMTNAIKFRKKNQTEVVIEISIRKQKNHLEVSLGDHASGIPDEDKKMIFKRFSKLSQDIPGSGLGLSISKRLVEYLGGQLMVENRPESPNDYSAGSVFKILLITT